MIGNTPEDDQHAWLVARWNFYLHRPFDEAQLGGWMTYLATNGSLRTEQAIAGSEEGELRGRQLLKLLDAQGGNPAAPTTGAGAGELPPLPAGVPQLTIPPAVTGAITPPVAHVLDATTGLVQELPKRSFPWEPGKLSSEFSLVVAWLVGHAAIVTAVLAGIGVHLSSGEVQTVLEWVGAETALVTTAYTAARTYRKTAASK